MHVKERGMSKKEPRMTMKEIIDSIPVGPRETSGKNSLKDLPTGGRSRRPEPRSADEHERQLLAVFHVWMKHPTAENPLETLANLMLAHEIRAYMAKAPAKQPAPANQ
jgi:hypothetical protein